MIEAILAEMAEDGYIIPPEGTPHYETLVEAIDRGFQYRGR